MTYPETPLAGEPREATVDAPMPPPEPRRDPSLDSGADPGVDAGGMPGPGAGRDPGPEAGPDLDPEAGPDLDPEAGPDLDPEVEVVDGFPVLAEVRTVERATPAVLPAVQVAAVAATGFVAGAATVALVKRRTARKLARNGRGGARRAADLLPIAASRSFLVDVHVIAKPE
jgi:hypothetical protein